MKGVFSFFLLLLDFLLSASAHERRYIGVWQIDTNSHIITGPPSFPAFLDKGAELTHQGLRLFDVEIFQNTNGRRYVGLWRGGSGTNLIVAPLNRVYQ